MATPKLYHYPKCSTCRKAIKWLDAHGIEVNLIDIVLAPPTKSELTKAKRLADVPVNKLFNTSGQLYREGNYKTKLETMTDAQAIAELSKHGKLIKRPLLIGQDFALIGFKEADWKATLT
jgi:Spx/MgsR family transcriptional regulator